MANARSPIRFLEGLFLTLPLNYADMLYLIPPYLATLSFGHKIGFWLALLAGVVYIGQETLYSLHWYNNLNNLWTATLFCFALLFLLTLARAVTKEKASRLRAEQLLQEVAHSHRQLTIYARQVAELATLKERNRIARDIHDGLGHALMAINIQLEKALVYHEISSQEAVEAVRAAKQVARGALQEVRCSVQALRSNQEGFSCLQGMAFLIQQLRASQFSVDYYVEGDEADFSQEIRLTLYRVAQEAFTNIQKHAYAKKVEVLLQFDEQEARMRICDNGWGFDPEFVQQKAAKGAAGYGLQGMRERITLVPLETGAAEPCFLAPVLVLEAGDLLSLHSGRYSHAYIEGEATGTIAQALRPGQDPEQPGLLRPSRHRDLLLAGPRERHPMPSNCREYLRGEQYACFVLSMASFEKHTMRFCETQRPSI